MRAPRSVAARILVASLVALPAALAAAQQVTKQEVAGVTNFARVETTVACGGAIKVEAVPELKKLGFVSIINLREATEAGANLEAEAAAAKAADLKYFSVPFNGQKPDPAAADQFLAAITTPGTEPAFIHCAGGGRAASMWFIKRMVIDHWDVDRASVEATALGMGNGALKQFAIDYAQSHKR